MSLFVAVGETDGSANGAPGFLGELPNGSRFREMLDLGENELAFITHQDTRERAIERYRWYVNHETDSTLVGEPRAHTPEELGVEEMVLLMRAGGQR